MKDYILLMHNDVAPEQAQASGQAWDTYVSWLRTTGHFGGGSSIGDGVCVRKDGAGGGITARLGGYIRVQAESVDDAKRFLQGNPVFEAGGTVEIRALPRD